VGTTGIDAVEVPDPVVIGVAIDMNEFEIPDQHCHSGTLDRQRGDDPNGDVARTGPKESGMSSYRAWFRF
jgi:hypothetical protein